MAKPISAFFEGLGFKLRNVRWSWGAKQDNILLLRTWADEYAGKDRTVMLLRAPDGHEMAIDSVGLDERIAHLETLWAGDIAGYTVIATAQDPKAFPRKIATYRDDAVFPVKMLELRADGAIVAKLGDPIPVNSLKSHAVEYRTPAAIGPFPSDIARRSGLSTDTYQQKVPAIREWLISVSQAKGKVTYSEVMDRFGLTFYPLLSAMSRIGHGCKDASEPILTSLIVDKTTLRCSQGLYDEFHVDDDELERQRCYAFWAQTEEDATTSAPTPAPDEDLAERAARFAQVEVRTQQAAFRQAVFHACRGRCVVSGCAVPEALEAAHLLDRDWRQGHNSANDGVLLRRDLHTLYDRGLLRITENGRVELASEIREYYGELDGTRVSCWPAGAEM